MKVTRDRPRKTGLLLAVALLDDLVVIGLIFLALWAFDVHLSAWSIVLLGLVFGSFVFVVHHALVPTFRRRAVTGAEGMIGREAVVADPLDPVGTVLVDGERWHARCDDEELPAGTDVEVVAVARLMLEVRRK